MSIIATTIIRLCGLSWERQRVLKEGDVLNDPNETGFIVREGLAVRLVVEGGNLVGPLVPDRNVPGWIMGGRSDNMLIGGIVRLGPEDINSRGSQLDAADRVELGPLSIATLYRSE